MLAKVPATAAAIVVVSSTCSFFLRGLTTLAKRLRRVAGSIAKTDADRTARMMHRPPAKYHGNAKFGTLWRTQCMLIVASEALPPKSTIATCVAFASGSRSDALVLPHDVLVHMSESAKATC